MQSGIVRFFLFLAFGIWFVHCQTVNPFPSDKINAKTNPVGTSIEWIKIKETVWVHKSFGSFQGKIYESNGLVVLTNQGVVVIDTAWTEPQTEELILGIQTKFQKDILFLLVTHAHDDRMAGVSLFHKRNIPVYSTNLTAKLAKEKGLGITNPILDVQTRFYSGNHSVEIFFQAMGIHLTTLLYGCQIPISFLEVVS